MVDLIATSNGEVHYNKVILTTNSKTGILVPELYVNNTSALNNSETLNVEDLGSVINELVVPELWDQTTLPPSITVISTNLTSSQIEGLISTNEYLFYTAWNSLRTVQTLESINPEGLQTSNQDPLKLWYDVLSGTNTEERLSDKEEKENPWANNPILSKVAITTYPLPEVTDKELDVVEELIILYSSTLSPSSSSPSSSASLSPFSSPSSPYSSPKQEDEETSPDAIFYVDKYAFLITRPNVKFQRIIQSLESYHDGLKTLSEIEAWLTVRGFVDYRTLFNISNLNNTIKLRSLNQGLEALDYYAGFPIKELDLQGAYITGDAVIPCFLSTNPNYKELINSRFPEFYTNLLEIKKREALRAYDVGLSVLGNNEYMFRAHNKNGLNDDFYLFNVVSGPPLVVLIDSNLGSERIKELEDSIFSVVVKYYPRAVTNVGDNGEMVISGAHRLVVVKHTVEETPELEILRSGFPNTRGWVTDNGNEGRNCILSASCYWSRSSSPEENDSYYFYNKDINDQSIRRQAGYHLVDEKVSGRLSETEKYKFPINVLYENGRDDLVKVVSEMEFGR